MNDSQIYNSILELRIDWSELDLFGHVNNVMYFKYLQAARVNYWDRTGLSESYERDRLGAMLLSTHCLFKQPLFYPGKITIKTKLEFIKNTSFGLQHHIFNDKNEIAAIGDDVIVFYDYNLNQKSNIPEWLRKNIDHLILG